MIHNRKGGWGGFVVVLVILAALVLVFVWFARDKIGKEEPPLVNETISYPLKLQSLANAPLQYGVFVGNTEVDSGKLRAGVTERYLGAIYNQSYEIRVRGQHHYFTAVNCKQLNKDDVCQVDPIRIADPVMLYRNEQLTVQAQDGIIQQALLCVSWKQPTLSVILADLQREPIPERLTHLIDRCYFLGNVEGSLRYGVEVRKSDRVPKNITFWVIDKEVDNGWVYTYETDSGLPDLTYEVTIQ